MYLADQLIITLRAKVPIERAHRLLTQLGMRIDAQLKRDGIYGAAHTLHRKRYARSPSIQRSLQLRK
jgi:hypothetical protein